MNRQKLLIGIANLLAILIVGRLLILGVDMLAERAHCRNRRMHDPSSIAFTFEEIDGECTKLHFFPFTRKP